MNEPGIHRYTKAINELFLFCPDKYADSVWNQAQSARLAWKEQELLNRCYSEKGFIEKLEMVVEELKAQRKQLPQVDQSDPEKYNLRRLKGEKKQKHDEDSEIGIFRNSEYLKPMRRNISQEIRSLPARFPGGGSD